MVNSVVAINVSQNEIITKQNESGEIFYIAYSGEYSTYVTGKNVTGKNETEPVLVNHIVVEKGMFPSFGELSLLYNCKRTATIIADQPGILFVINKTAFRKAVLGCNDKIQQILRSVKLFKSLTCVQIRDIAKLFEEVNYEKGKYIIRQGEKGNTLYIVSHGEVLVTKNSKGPLNEMYNKNIILIEK